MTNATQQTGLTLKSESETWVSLPVYKFPEEGIITIQADFKVPSKITSNNRALTLRNSPFEINFTILRNSKGQLSVSTDVDTQTIELGQFIEGEQYNVIAWLNLDNGDVGLTINGETPSNPTNVKGVEGFRKLTTNEGTDTSVGNANNVSFADLVFYQLKIGSQVDYHFSDNAVIDVLGGESGVIINGDETLPEPLEPIEPIEPIATVKIQQTLEIPLGASFTQNIKVI